MAGIPGLVHQRRGLNMVGVRWMTAVAAYEFLGHSGGFHAWFAGTDTARLYGRGQGAMPPAGMRKIAAAVAENLPRIG
jgi:hypothetical protein